ncbi:MAG: hypothetical protein LBT29_03490 [Flavobacteriaceae bacterium]|jgi:hypothetical protein|nr:hypothetical protein [Flavobacteriaceae bacterium]
MIEKNTLIHADNLSGLNHLLTNGVKGKIDLAIQVTKENLNEIQGDLFVQKAEYKFLNLEQPYQEEKSLLIETI